ncbi:MAG: glutathione S-transferase C-terminal domain-containing protein [Chlamydiales bacterium]|nr:glutathione S-transferase C-terminal domain-containing protein [Chlamydiales bacterium]
MQYLQIVEKELEPATGVLNLHIKGYEQLNEAQLEKSREIHTKLAKRLNDTLALRSFLVGDRVTIADISCFHNLESVSSLFEKDWEKLKNLSRWMGHLRSIC